MEHLLNLMAALSVALIVVVLVSLRREHIRVEYSVSWLLAAVVLLALSLSRPLLDGVASLLRIDNPPLALMMVVCITFLIVFFRFSVVMSHLKDAHVATTQRLAIVEYHLRTLNEKTQTDEARRG